MGLEHHAVDQLGRPADNTVEGRRRLVGGDILVRVRSHPHPHQALAFGHGIGAHADAIGFYLLAGRQGGDARAHAVGAKLPAMIRALDRLGAVGRLDQLAGRQGRRAVRTHVAQTIGLARPVAA